MNIEQRASRATIAGVRIVAGLLWLANLNWKRPPNFGRTNGSGLFKYVQLGIDHPTFPPFHWALQHLVKPHMSAFGWFTLLLESSLAALLMLGWHTRPVALVAAGQAAAIGLSVAQAPNEWPWSYVLMVCVHLLLAAVDAGKVAGLDGLRAKSASTRPVVLSMGAASVAVGIAGVIAAASSPFTSRTGSLVGQVSYEMKFVWFNTLAALICIAIGLVALAGWLLKRREPVLLAAAAAGLCAVQVIVQWRAGAHGETGGILGATGGTLGWWLLLAIGLGLSSTKSEPA